MATKPNPYKLVPVRREEEAPKDAWTPPTKPAFDKGDMVTTVYRPRFFSIDSPTEVLDLKANRRFVSGWGVTIKDPESGHDHELDSSHFSKAQPGR